MSVNVGDVFESRDRRDGGRRVLVVDIEAAPQKGGNGANAKGPVALVDRTDTGRRTRIAVWRLASSRWALVSP